MEEGSIGELSSLSHFSLNLELLQKIESMNLKKNSFGGFIK